MYRNKTARQHNFATIPRSDIPRSKFRMRQTRKQAFDASDLIPIMCEEVLPGDTWTHKESIMARLATPIAPVIDDADLETFYFFVPCRILWPKWEDFIAGVNTAITIPQLNPIDATVPEGRVIANGVLDHFGITPQATSGFTINVMPIWAYFTIWNEWFRDQNLQPKYEWPDTWTTNSTAAISNGITPWNQEPLRPNKRHDYFTSSLPWPQKGTAVTIPLGTTAPIVTSGTGQPTFNADTMLNFNLQTINGLNTIAKTHGNATGTENLEWNDPALMVDLSQATSATINALRLAATTQRMLEADARGGSRYVEQLLVHFGVRSPDYRLQRPEYLGGTKTPITVNPIAQTATYGAEPDPGEESALGNLGAEMHISSSRRTFNYAATEHGYIIGLACIRATPTYQQGTRRHWRRLTRFDYYFPEFAHLGEQAVATQEIYQSPTNTPTTPTWGYQERWAEYRYTPNEITGVLRSTAAQPLDWWHYAELFGTEPTLSPNFITDKTKETMARSLATAPSEQWSAQIIMDILHDSQVARLMPTYSVPGITKF